jgi:hypothetical protein
MKIIITGQTSLLKFGEINETVYHLPCLPRNQSLKLLKAKSPPNCSYKEEITELMKNQDDKVIHNHPLFTILEVMPLSGFSSTWLKLSGFYKRGIYGTWFFFYDISLFNLMKYHSKKPTPYRGIAPNSGRKPALYNNFSPSPDYAIKILS